MSASGSNHGEQEPELTLERLGETNILARGFRAGRSASFPELFERVTPALRAWIELRLRRESARRIDAQDILQEVWLRALQGFDTYDAQRSFRAWLLGIAKNVLLQSHAQRTVAFSLSPDAHPSSGGAPQLTDEATSIFTRLAKDDSFKGFMDFVDGLEPEEQALLLYCGIEGYSCAQAAARLGISSEATNKRWQVLRARLKQNSGLEALAATILE